MLRVPAVLKVVVHCALADTKITAPQPAILTPPFLKMMVPVGEMPFTMAVKVTAPPTVLGDWLEVMTV